MLELFRADFCFTRRRSEVRDLHRPPRFALTGYAWRRGTVRAKPVRRSLSGAKAKTDQPEGLNEYQRRIRSRRRWRGRYLVVADSYSGRCDIDGARDFAVFVLLVFVYLPAATFTCIGLFVWAMI